MAAREGRVRGRAARLGALRAGRGPAGGLGARAPLPAAAPRSGCSPRSAARTYRWRAPGFGAGAGRREARRARPALPQGRAARRSRRPRPRPPAWSTPTATSTSASRPTPSLSSGRASGGREPDRDGRDERGLDRRAPSRRAEAHEEVFAIVGRHPHETAGFGDGDLEAIARAARAPARPGDRRDRARLLPRPGAARGPAAGLRGPARAGRPRRASRGHPHPRGRGGHVRPAPRARGRADRRAALLLRPGSPRGVRRARLPLLVRRQRDLPQGHRAAGRRPRAARRAAAGGDRRAVPRPAAGARQAQRAGQRAHDRRGGGGPARDLVRGAGAHRRAKTRSGCSGGERRAAPGQPPPPAPLRRPPQPRARPELPDRRQPARRDRAGGRARPGRRGARGGRRARRAVRVPGPARGPPARGGGRPRARAGPAGRARARTPTPSCTWRTPWRSTSRALDPAPTKVVANLPYGVAATVLLRTIAELPEARLWVAMVQREVAERLAAGPGTRTYGATSVLAQLSCEVRLLRRVPPTVFHPAPERRVGARAAAPDVGPRRRTGVVALVHAGFAHRRKALAGSLALAPGAPAGPARPHPRGARGDRPSRRTPARSGWHPRTGSGWPRRLGEETLSALRPREG